MAAEVGLTEHHKTFYAGASHLYHVSIWALATQADDPTGDAEIAPSAKWVTTALMAAHTYALGAMAMYNYVAGLDF